MRESAASKGKDLANVQGQDFLRTVKREAWKAAPTKQELVETAQALKWRLKRKKGVTPAKELARRMRARGTFARGWQIVKITSEKYRTRIWLMDKSAESGKVDEAHKTSDRAEKQTGTRFKQRLDKLAQSVTSILT